MKSLKVQVVIFFSILLTPNIIVTYFSGIILCEIIGRVDPDPDYLPRTTEFGLSVAHYYVQFALKNGCPEYFFAIAVRVSEILFLKSVRMLKEI